MHFSPRIGTFALILTFGSMLGTTSVLQAATGNVDGAASEITITTIDHSFSAPAEVSAGYVAVTIQNDGHEPHHVQLVRLKENVSVETFSTALRDDLAEAIQLVHWVGGPSLVGHEGRSTVTLHLEPGTHMLLCLFPDANGVPHLAHGMAGVMQVVPGEGGNTTPPAADLTVDLLDFAYAFSDGIAAGPQTWEIVNDGKEIHEISLVKLVDGATMEDVGHFMHTMEGPPPFSFVGGMQAIDPGASGWLHLDLTPGTYVAICHIPDMASGKTHADLGMIMPFEVH